MKYLMMLCIMVAVCSTTSVRAQTLTVWPNPFADTVHVRFTIDPSDTVSLVVMNTVGSAVRTILIDTLLQDSVTELSYNGSDLPDGIYFFSLQNGSKHTVTKVLKTGGRTGLTSISVENNITAYPIPCDGVLNVNLPQPAALQLWSADGRCLGPVVQQSTQPGVYTLDMSGYAGGVYYIMALDDRGGADILRVSKKSE